MKEKLESIISYLVEREAEEFLFGCRHCSEDYRDAVTIVVKAYNKLFVN